MLNLLPRDEKYFERFTEMAVRIQESARILDQFFLNAIGVCFIHRSELLLVCFLNLVRWDLVHNRIMLS